MSRLERLIERFQTIEYDRSENGRMCLYVFCSFVFCVMSQAAMEYAVEALAKAMMGPEAKYGIKCFKNKTKY